MPIRFLGRHRVRALFYHVTALLAVSVEVLNQLNIIDKGLAYYFIWSLFFIDYMAEMFDPNPNKKGPWYKKIDAFFHRFFDNKDD
jgi:hypothetical protein